MKALKQLAELEFRERYKNSSMPEYSRFKKRYSDRTANGLTRAIIDWLKLNGNQAERINTTGRMLDQRKVVTDVIGRTRQIGSTKWIKGSGQRGSADISATIRGQSVKIEIKIGRDRQSEHQKEYQKQIEQAGGQYWIIRTFDQFVELYNEKNPGGGPGQG